MPSFLTYSDEAKIIGNLLAGYTDLEVGLLNCIQVVRAFEFDTVLKAMFRVRGETNRIKIADALGRVREQVRPFPRSVGQRTSGQMARFSVFQKKAALEPSAAEMGSG
jgi:hypothetical protein